MKFDILVEKILNEAIPLSIAKKAFCRNFFKNNYTPRLNKIFNNKDRIILPFKNDEDVTYNMAHDRESSPYLDIKNFLELNTNKLSDFLKIKLKNESDEEFNYRVSHNQHENESEEQYNQRHTKRWNDYIKYRWKNTHIFDLNDYIEGYAYKVLPSTVDGKVAYQKDPKQKNRIGKLLQDYGREDLLKRFKEDKVRQAQKEYVIVISRHPYDIAGASTDRNWTSCIDNGYPRIVYKDKDYNKKFMKSVSHLNPETQKFDEQVLIAYLVPKNELMQNGKIALKKPISRILIDQHNGGFYLSDEDGFYGVQSDNFKLVVQKWLSDNDLINKYIYSSDEKPEELEDI
jgi:hypothetical protein